MKRALICASMGVGLIVGAGTSAAAQPKGEPELWMCGGEPTEIVTAGRNGWIDGVKYQATSFTVVGTFTPTIGSVQPVNESKVWGNAEPDFTCTQHIDETGPDGHFVGNATVHVMLP